MFINRIWPNSNVFDFNHAIEKWKKEKTRRKLCNIIINYIIILIINFKRNTHNSNKLIIYEMKNDKIKDKLIMNYNLLFIIL